MCVARVGPAALLGLAALALLLNEDDPSAYRWGFQLAAVLAVVAVGAVATREGAISRRLALEPLPWLGRRSYGIYLWSWPIQVFTVERFALAGLELAAVVVVGSVALAALSFALVEEPIRTGRTFRRRGDRAQAARPGRGRVGYASGTLAVGAVIALVLGATAGARDGPGLQGVSDGDAVAAALRPPENAPADPSVTIPAAPRSGEVSSAGAQPGLGSGPFDPSVPLLVDPSDTRTPSAADGARSACSSPATRCPGHLAGP